MKKTSDTEEMPSLTTTFAVIILLAIIGAVFIAPFGKADADDYERKLTIDGKTVVLDRDGFGHPRTIARFFTQNGCEYVTVFGVGGNSGHSITHSEACQNPAHSASKK